MDVSTTLSFEPVDVARHGALCISFREDVLLLALGSTRALHKLPGSMVEEQPVPSWRRQQHYPIQPPAG